MKFAFLIMGPCYNREQDHASIHDERAQIIGVANLEEACAIAQKLCAQGVSCIELCGAFGEEGARRVIEATQNKIPVGYITHLPEQEEVYQAAFGQ